MHDRLIDDHLGTLVSQVKTQGWSFHNFEHTLVVQPTPNAKNQLISFIHIKIVYSTTANKVLLVQSQTKAVL